MRLLVATAAAVLVLGGTAAAASTTQEVDANLLVRGSVTVNRALIMRQSHVFVMPAGVRRASTPVPAIGSASSAVHYFAVATIQGAQRNLWVRGAEVDPATSSATVWLNRAPDHDTTIGLGIFGSDYTP